MSDKVKNKRKAIAMGIVGLSCLMGVATTAFVIGLSLNHGAINSAASNEELDLKAIATNALSAGGFGFANIDFTDGIMKITGDAPNAEARNHAFNAAKAAVLEQSAQNEISENLKVRSFENAITINGEKIDDLPDTLSSLGDKPQADDCQNAYDVLLNGHKINFTSGSAIVKDESKPLLDALSQIAIRCVNYQVEVGGHTDSTGDDYANQALSERRAQAVADYLVGKGVAAQQLAVKGYGEAKPLIANEKSEADHAANRRIEFTTSTKE